MGGVVEKREELTDAKLREVLKRFGPERMVHMLVRMKGRDAVIAALGGVAEGRPAQPDAAEGHRRMERIMKHAMADLAKEACRVFAARDRLKYSVMNRSDAAAVLCCSERTIDRLLAAGRLNARKVGRRVLISTASVNALLPPDGGAP